MIASAPPSPVAITTRAAILAGPRLVELAPVALHAPGSREIAVAIEGCGLCGSNLPLWEGRPWFEYPLPPGAPGHEAWGRVTAAGDRVRDLPPGTPVALLAERALAGAVVCDARLAVPLPAALDGRVFPGEAIGCAMNIFGRSDIRAGQTVAIVGVGFLGAILCRLAASAGARVIAISRRAFALETGRRFGAHETIPMDDHARALERARTLTGGRGCERVIEAVGLQSPLDLASDLVTEGGRLIIAGYHQDGPRQVNMQQWNWKGIDVVNAHERDEHVRLDGIRAAAEAVASGALDLDPLYTHRLPIDRIGDAFDLLATRPDGFLKAVVVMG